MKKFWLTLILCLTCAFCAVGFAACGMEFKINFVVDGEIYATVNTSGAETIKMPDNPTKDDYTFDGWFWDKDTWQQPFTANSLLNAPLSSDMSVYAKFKPNHTHEYTEQITKEPTCTEKGEKTFTCECGDSYTEEINALGHKFTNYVSDNNATYEQDGTKTAVCDRGCGATDTVTDEGSKLPEITEYFDKQQDGTYYGKVYNATTQFDFTGKIDYDGEYLVCTDAACRQPLADNKTSLAVGDNTFYILYDNGNKTTATVRRRTICTVTFNSAGGTAVSSQTVEEDRRITAPKSPMRVGYTFNAWDHDFNEPITANTTVTALWNANTNTPYKIEYYLQNLENDNYTLQENDTENLTGTTDTTVAATKTYEHFTVVASTASANISPDGTTVLQVRYTRDKYTYTAQNENTKGGTITCTNNGTYKFNTEISLSATLNIGYDFDGWYNGDKKMSDELQYNFNISENSNIVAKYFAHTDTPYKAEYYLQNLDDDNYTLTDTDNLTGTTDTTATAEIKTYEHFTVVDNTISGNINGDGLTILQVYYTRDKYTVQIFSSNDGVTLSQTFNGQYKYGYIIPEITANYNTIYNNYLGYEWNGWFKDNEFLTEDFMMPSFAVDKDIDYCAKVEKAEMSNFIFTATETTCTITGIKDKTVTEIIVPDYVTSIESSAFSGCNSLTSITIPDSVTSIESDAFYGCPIENAIIPSIACLYIKNGNLKTVEITSGNSIGNSAFRSCSSLTNIAIPDSVTSIGKNAFYECSSLTSITIPDSVTSIEDSTFYKCSSLTSVTIGNNVTNIGYDAFGYCRSLTSVIIPDSVTNIGQWAFAYCSSLTSVIIPDSVTSIGRCAFTNCSSLKSITIPDGVTSIKDCTFYYCSSLTSVTIGNSVTRIEDYAFKNCSSLENVIYYGTTEQWQAISKGKEWKKYVPSSCIVHCIDGDINI